ncbi:hypothetical protein [uncultured Rubinisphaera sp.]|uniref:hypothetical protein n=1 Tax=uncultured Rubinisphaera sp. TaxID=1678686 RepID=UPI0026D9C06B
MKLTRITDQSRYTLAEEFSTDNSAGDGKRIAFAAMRQLLQALEAVDGPSLYVYTSLFRLCFVNDDDFRLPTITRCTPYYQTTESGKHIALFQIAFPAIPELRDENWTRWTTSDIGEAIQMILTSIQQSAFASNDNPSLDK